MVVLLNDDVVLDWLKPTLHSNRSHSVHGEERFRSIQVELWVGGMEGQTMLTNGVANGELRNGWGS